MKRKITKPQMAMSAVAIWVAVALYRTVAKNRALSRSQAAGPFLQSFAHNALPLIPDVPDMPKASLEF